MVYPGPNDSSADRQYNGTYEDDDKVEADCWTNGRLVRSHPEVGEEDRSSDVWIRIIGSTGTKQFATAVYIERPENLISRIPEC
jgi:hypothetical protein